jgi:predicted transcriptional regulator
MSSPELLEDPLEIGRLIGAACGYTSKNQSEIASELGRDERTLRSYIRGNLGDYSTPELREGLIRRIEEITECPPTIFGLSEPEPTEADRLRREIAAQRQELEEEMDAVKTELLEEIQKALYARASEPPSTKPAEGDS